MKNKIDIKPEHLKIVQTILAEHLPRTLRFWVFGSRATGKAKPYSDLDLALEGDEKIDHEILCRLELAFEESDLPWKVDVIDLKTVTPTFLAAIEKDKVPFEMY